MRTSLIETQQIEAHLQQQMQPADALVFEAKRLIDPDLDDKIAWQRRTYQLVQQYGRKQLRQEIESIHQKLFTADEHKSFAQKVLSLFKKH